MESLRKLETQLNEVFTTKAPFQLPPNARKGLADALWIVALVLGIVQLWSALLLWRAGEHANKLVDTANYLSRLYGNGDTVDHLGPFFYLSLIFLVIQGALMLAAVPGLRVRSKAKGWNYLFYVALLGVVYGFIRMFSDVEGGFGNLLMAVVGAAIGAYLLFQVREHFGKAHPSAKPKGSDAK